MNPLVSIIIPVFNQNEEFLRDCINSALEQSYENVEIVISNNHSTNDTAAVISSYHDGRLKIFSPSTFLNMNDHFAFAASCVNTNSKYISFLSSDDLLAPNAIKELVVFAENNPSAVFIAGNIIEAVESPANFEQFEHRIRTAEHKVGLYTFQDAIGLFCPWRKSSTWMVGDLIKYEAYNATGGFSACDYYISGDLWLTKELLKLKNNDFGCIRITTGFFRLRADGILPADGDRSLSTDLDMLRYCIEMLKIIKNKNINIELIISLYLVRFKKLSKLILFSLHSRKFGYPYNKFYQDILRRYAENIPTNIEKKSLSWALSIQGVSLSIFATLALHLMNVRGSR
jgi:glycosyltransferase involved in cell wall biosynthesis